MTLALSGVKYYLKLLSKENKSEAAIIWQFFRKKGENPHRYN